MYRKHSRALLAAVVLFSIGCAATSQQAVRMAPTFDIASGHRVLVYVDRWGSGSREERDSLSRQVMQQLEASGVFGQVDLKTLDDDEGDLLVKCKIVQIRRVNDSDRALKGAFAGVASVEVEVTLVELASGNLVGEGTVTGKSSGGTIFAGTTEQAIEKAAEGIASFVTSRQ